MRKLYQNKDLTPALTAINRLKLPPKKPLQPIPETFITKLTCQQRVCPRCKVLQPDINFYQGASELNNMWVLEQFVLDNGPYKGVVVCKTCYQVYLDLLQEKAVSLIERIQQYVE